MEIDKGAVSIIVTLDTVEVGDWITEIDTPEGPFYDVVGITDGVVTVDAREDAADESLPVELPHRGPNTGVRMLLNGKVL